jgi:glucosylceramidase
MEALEWRVAGSAASGIRIDPALRYQEILGFGAAFTDASCYLLSKLTPAERQALMSELFGPEGLRLSVCRTCIGSSDYSTSAYSFDEGGEPDPQLQRFSIEHDRGYILPVLRMARSINPDLFLFSSPWSPPAWMKSGKTMMGGSMQKRSLAPYSEYFVRFLRDYAAEGVKINAVTVQNEVDTDQDGRMPAALWGQEYEIEFVRKHLGPAFERAHLDTKIWILDHNYDLWGRVLDELSNADVYKYVDGVAWHGYGGTPDAMTRVHEAFPDKHNYWTEGGPDITRPDYATDWTKWSSTFTRILRNWARCIVAWNLALDEKGMPNIGPFHCGGMVTVDSSTHKITRSGQYWAFAHYSKVLQRGARVIGSHGELPGIDHLAIENPDGSHVLVVTNSGEKRNVQCGMEGRALDLTLEPNSIATLVW